MGEEEFCTWLSLGLITSMFESSPVPLRRLLEVRLIVNKMNSRYIDRQFYCGGSQPKTFDKNIFLTENFKFSYMLKKCLAIGVKYDCGVGFKRIGQVFIYKGLFF